MRRALLLLALALIRASTALGLGETDARTWPSPPVVPSPTPWQTESPNGDCTRTRLYAWISSGGKTIDLPPGTRWICLVLCGAGGGAGRATGAGWSRIYPGQDGAGVYMLRVAVASPKLYIQAGSEGVGFSTGFGLPPAGLGGSPGGGSCTPGYSSGGVTYSLGGGGGASFVAEVLPDGSRRYLVVAGGGAGGGPVWGAGGGGLPGGASGHPSCTPGSSVAPSSLIAIPGGPGGSISGAPVSNWPYLGVRLSFQGRLYCAGGDESHPAGRPGLVLVFVPSQ